MTLLDTHLNECRRCVLALFPNDVASMVHLTKSMVILAACIGSLFFPASGQDLASERPNIVLIVVDDLGWKDLGFMGSNYYETPHLDQLASEGMVFTQAYASAANCAPSRACMISGLQTPRHGIYTVGDPDRGETRARRIIATQNNEHLPDSIFTLPEMLLSHGYATGIFGKWHLGDDPKKAGFQVNAGGSHRGNPGKNGYFSPYNVDFLPDGPDGEYLTDRLTDEAIQFLQDNRRNPFFLYLPFYSVHTPISGKEEIVNRFLKKKGVPGQDRPDYAAMIASVDENIGRLLHAMTRLSLNENTLVIFTSDNGGIRDISYQNPLRAGKGSYYEGGIRVPMTVRWPGKIAPGSHCDTPVTNLDFYPTLQGILRAEKIAKTLDGADISPLFRGKSIPQRALVWHFPFYLQAYNPAEDDGRDPLFRTRPGSVIRMGHWKLHEYFEDGMLELYNLDDDLGETRNVAREHPEKANELYRMLNAWRLRTRAPIPRERNPEYDPDFEKQLTQKMIKRKS